MLAQAKPGFLTIRILGDQSAAGKFALGNERRFGDQLFGPVEDVGGAGSRPCAVGAGGQLLAFRPALEGDPFARMLVLAAVLTA